MEEAARGGNLTPVSGADKIVVGDKHLSEVSDRNARVPLTRHLAVAEDQMGGLSNVRPQEPTQGRE